MVSTKRVQSTGKSENPETFLPRDPEGFMEVEAIRTDMSDFNPGHVCKPQRREGLGVGGKGCIVVCTGH